MVASRQGRRARSSSEARARPSDAASGRAARARGNVATPNPGQMRESAPSRAYPPPVGTARARRAAAPDARGDDPRLVARVHRRDRRHRRAPDDRGGPRPRAHRAAVDLPLLLAGARLALPRRRRDRRPLRPPAACSSRARRASPLASAARRRRAERGRAHPRADAPGRRGRVPDHELARAPPRRLRGGGRPRDRAVDVVHERRHDPRAAGRRRARRVGLLALDLPPQPPARGGGGRARPPRPRRRAGARRATGPARPPRRRARRDRLRLAHVRPRRGRRPGLRRASGGRSSSRRPRSRRSSSSRRGSAEPMLPFALFRERNFAAANAETFLVYAGLYGFLVFFTLYLQFLGLHALRGRAPQHPRRASS